MPTKNGKTTVHGTVVVPDANKVRGLLTVSAMTPGITVKRAVASVNAQVKKAKRYKPRPMNHNYVVEYSVKGGKEVVTKVKKVK